MLYKNFGRAFNAFLTLLWKGGNFKLKAEKSRAEPDGPV